MTVRNLLNELNGHVFRASSGNVAVLILAGKQIEERVFQFVLDPQWARLPIQSDYEELAGYLKERCQQVEGEHAPLDRLGIARQYLGRRNVN
jgi:hypothetical protein